jgi:hypothetical protein
VAPGDSWISDSDRLALLRHGIVVLEVEAAGLRVGVAGYGEARVRRIVARRLGHAVTVDVLGDVPRRLEARRCVGWMERERGRLQLRFRLRGDEHVDDVVVEEDERTVVVLATVCTRIADEPGPCYEAPAHVSLDRPLGDRAVIDGATGAAVPYKNVYAALSRSQP